MLKYICIYFYFLQIFFAIFTSHCLFNMLYINPSAEAKSKPQCCLVYIFSETPKTAKQLLLNTFIYKIYMYTYIFSLNIHALLHIGIKLDRLRPHNIRSTLCAMRNKCNMHLSTVIHVHRYINIFVASSLIN